MKHMVPPDIEAYAAAHSWAESEACCAIREETDRTMESPQMVVGPLEGAFLKMMTQVTGAGRVLEIGTFTGYSALCFAEAMRDDGIVITCDIDPESTAVARKHFAESPHGYKIDLRVGPALVTLREIAGPFDLIFIDADKDNYLNYYRCAIDLIALHGIILIDNVLWSGEVLQYPPVDTSAAVIQELNRIIAADTRVTAVMVTIRDGIYVIRHNGL